MTLLLIIILIAASQLASADGLLEDCPIDDEQLVEVLEAFYNDLRFVRVVTESRQSRDYEDLFREIKTSLRPGIVRERLLRGAIQLSTEYWLQFTRTVYSHRAIINNDDQGRSYSNFLFAEFTRLRGSTDRHYLHAAIKARQQHTGVSVNQLEKLDGLMVLQLVCKFNHDVDWSHGLKKSPDNELLSLIHPLVKHQTEPLNDLRAAIFDRLFKTGPRFGYTESNKSSELDDIERDDLHLYDLRGHSVSESAIKAILCELVQKLSILGASPEGDETIKSMTGHDSDFIEQVRKFDADFADDLYKSVLIYIDTDIAKSLENVSALRRDLDGSELSMYKGIFLTYIEVELKLRLGHLCNLDLLSWLGDELHVIRYIRRTREGVSIGNIMSLVGRFVSLQMRCFHKRLQWAYALDGNEDEHQLEKKRTELGTCQRILPPFDSP